MGVALLVPTPSIEVGELGEGSTATFFELPLPEATNIPCPGTESGCMNRSTGFQQWGARQDLVPELT